MKFISFNDKSLKMQNMYIIRSNISGLLCSLIFIRSFMAMMMLFVLSSVPCFELFSAAPKVLNQNKIPPNYISKVMPNA